MVVQRINSIWVMKEFKSQTVEALKDNCSKTKRIMQVLTGLILVLTVVLLFGWISKTKGLDSNFYITMIMPLSLIVILLDRKIKKIKEELTTRE